MLFMYKKKRKKNPRRKEEKKNSVKTLSLENKPENMCYWNSWDEAGFKSEKKIPYEKREVFFFLNQSKHIINRLTKWKKKSLVCVQ